MANAAPWFLVFILALGTSRVAFATDWEALEDRDVIQSFRQRVPGQTAIGVKGRATMDVPIQYIAELLLDADGEKKKEWVDMLSDFYVLDSSPTVITSYTLVSMPWPLEDRDFVVRTAINFDDVNHELLLSFASDTHPKAPPTPGVRGEMSQGTYRLRALSSTTTLVEVETQVSLKGMIPDWVVNYAQKSWPYNTLTKMKAAAMKSDSKPNRLVLDKLKQWNMSVAVDRGGHSNLSP